LPASSSPWAASRCFFGRSRAACGRKSVDSVEQL
jgi:hypothetical protein